MSLKNEVEQMLRDYDKTEDGRVYKEKEANAIASITVNLLIIGIPWLMWVFFGRFF